MPSSPLVLILGLMATFLGGQVIVKAMSVLVFLFVVTLMGLALYLIPALERCHHHRSPGAG